MRLRQYCVGCKNQENHSQKPQKTSYTHQEKLSSLSEFTKVNFAVLLILALVSLTFSYLTGLPYVDIIGFTVGLANFVIGIFFYLSLKGGAIALLEQRQT